MTLGSPRKSKSIALNTIKDESLGSKGECDEKMSDGEVARFARKFKKHMKFKKYKKSKENAKKMEQFNGKIKCKRQKERQECKKGPWGWVLQVWGKDALCHRMSLKKK